MFFWWNLGDWSSWIINRCINASLRRWICNDLCSMELEFNTYWFKPDQLGCDSYVRLRAVASNSLVDQSSNEEAWSRTGSRGHWALKSLQGNRKVQYVVRQKLCQRLLCQKSCYSTFQMNCYLWEHYHWKGGLMQNIFHIQQFSNFQRSVWNKVEELYILNWTAHKTDIICFPSTTKMKRKTEDWIYMETKRKVKYIVNLTVKCISWVNVTDHQMVF